MVKVREVHSLKDGATVELHEWLGVMAHKYQWSPAVVAAIKLACEHSWSAEERAIVEDNIWAPGTSSFRTGLEMAEILADLHMDHEGLQAAILYRAVREGKLPLEVVRRHFDARVADLIANVLRMAVISTLRNDSEREVFGHASALQAAKVREMLVSIIDDVRVALIKLGERTCAIRALKSASEHKRIRVAREIFDVYAPLAHRLGVGHLKWELEDLAFRYLEPDEYQQIAKLLDEKRLDRQHYIDEVTTTIENELRKIGKQGTVTGRAKHIYSIWRKMHRNDIGFSQVYDIRAVRVLVPTVDDCYGVLGIVHSRWRNIPREFDDYIASPKENGYRSLHTAVVGPGRKVVEIQIRTFEMHQEAEFGVCAHWQYKGTDAKNAADANYEDKIAWLRQVLEWHEEIEDENVKEFLRLDSSPDRVYVFTPEGHVIDLPFGATPLDFAYSVHTQIGHRCRGAKLNGKIVPLNTGLKTGDQVQIITGKQDKPSRDWLLKSLGYLHTSRARAKVQQWFRAQHREQNVAAGTQLLNAEFRQLGIRALDLQDLAGRFNKHNEEGLYAAIGAGDVGLEQVVHAAQTQLGLAPEPTRQNRRKRAARFGKSDFYIYGVGDLLTRLAGCCSPIPGDAVCGYITAGRGVTIHRADCGNLLRLQSTDPKRVLQVNWGGTPQQTYAVKVGIHSYDRTGLLKDITTTIDKAGLFIVALTSAERRESGNMTEVTVDVTGMQELSALMAKLRQIPNVIDVTRLHD